MDLSAKYIKMCGCPEIQKQWEPEIGDWYYRSGKSINLVKGKAFKIHYLDWKSHPQHEVCRKIYQEHTWLPKQDQIQAMIPENGKCNCTACLVFRLRFFLEEDTSGLFNAGVEGIMEQLWLAFYMYERHNLKWTNGKWEEVE